MRFCTIARGSLIEVYSHLAFAARMEYLSRSTFDDLSNELSEVHRILNGYIGFLKRTKQGGSVVSEPKTPYDLSTDGTESEYDEMELFINE